MNYSVLVVEDRKDMIDLLQHHLEKAGYQTLIANSGEFAMEIIAKEKIDLILLDLMLPKMNGIEILKRLKQNEKTNQIPVIIESAKSEDQDVIIGLELGAEDYITKPYSPKVLLARIEKVLQRYNKNTNRLIVTSNGQIKIDMDKHEVWILENEIYLTVIEFGILSCLVENQNKILTREKILDAVWQNKTIVGDRVIDVHMNSLRKKLGPLSSSIQTIRGIGYRVKANFTNHEK